MTNIQAIDLLKGLEQSLDDYCELNDEGKTAFHMAITALEVFGNSEQLPSAQPEPKEGHWIEGGIYRDVIECNCSECGQLMTTAATVRMNFCPNCGAKMKGVTP